MIAVRRHAISADTDPWLIHTPVALTNLRVLVETARNCFSVHRLPAPKKVNAQPVALVAAGLAPDHARGRIVGRVTSGLLTGT
ncbi:hypothetical protein ACFYZB_25655 [Streptomyces sp. NPDC001852]|uniref:hypothetical protein n=1 Tax=Streptomyces sp. NPDC001852 TaxID=3364619 RepID=UPI0036AEFC07